jgi:hypothetical protein
MHILFAQEHTKNPHFKGFFRDARCIKRMFSFVPPIREKLRASIERSQPPHRDTLSGVRVVFRDNYNSPFPDVTSGKST